MKRTIMTIVAILTIAVSAGAMSYEQARREALFLTDKMAYELNLDDRQYDAAYEINLDYLMGVTSRNDVYGTYWSRRNLDLSYVLLDWQWNAFCAATYFYRPLYWSAGYWHFGIYARYPRRDYFYFGRPTVYLSYRGGHSWRSNGGRSYYKSRHDIRPKANRHHGLRDRWNSGDTKRKNGNSFNSSTRVTVNNNDRPNTSARPNTGSSKTGGSFSGLRSSETTTRKSASPSSGSGSRTGGSFGTSRTTGHNINIGTSSVRTATNAGTRFSTASPVEKSSTVKSSSSVRNTSIRPSTSSLRTSGATVKSNSSSMRSSGMSSMRSSKTSSVKSAGSSPRTPSSHHTSSGSGAKTSGSFGGHR